MRLPSVLYGPYREIKPRIRKVVTRLKRGANWDDALGAADTLDTATTPGLLVLNGPSPLLGGTSHFQCYLPLLVVQEVVSQNQLSGALEEPIFQACLQTPWGTLGLFAPANLMWVYPPKRYRPLLQAALRFWDTLDAEDERYTVGSNDGQRLWSIASNLKYVLANVGIPKSTLNSPLPPEGVADLIRSVLGRNGDSV
jgi:hypothetical protein